MGSGNNSSSSCLKTLTEHGAQVVLTKRETYKNHFFDVDSVHEGTRCRIEILIRRRDAVRAVLPT